ncbi:hypothetical protein LJC10_06140 [Selenomonadales bacterium OttesenSCG-928-I06]|nr:hypothetical protein [Selenomonadales bacterium OttesenSCG-928-I06]
MKFKVDTNKNKETTINRTIRIRNEHFDKIMELSEKSNVSFNKIINQCIEFALENLEEEENIHN